MDLVPYVAAAQEYLASHPAYDAVGGFVLGGLAANPLTCADLMFATISKIPPLKWVVVKNWAAIDAFLDRFQERFAKDIKDDATPIVLTPPVEPAVKPCPPQGESNMAGGLPPVIPPTQS